MDYISKPISPEITLARISTHIEQVKQRERITLQLDTMIENIRLKVDIERITHHDLKNPLAVIISAADSMQHKQSYSKQDVEIITESAHTIQEMVDQQMIIHQLENNSTQREMSSINALALFNKVLYRQKLKCKKNNIFVKYKITNTLNFLGNQLLCFNMFNNLLENAIEASSYNQTVNISIEEKSGTVIFYIHNKRIIPENIQARFFDKFITHGKAKGTGLGTYSAKL